MNVRLEYSIGFTAGVWWEGRLIMNNYLIRFYMVTNCSEPANQNIAFERLKYMIFNEFGHTVFINRSNHEQCNKLAQAGINVTTLPAEPVDQIIGMMLYCKINSVMEERIIISEIELSSELGENMVYLHAADENLGPFGDAGWWSDSDPIHCDITLMNNDKVVAMHSAGIWRELGLSWVGQDVTPDIDNTVVFADFKNNETK